MLATLLVLTALTSPTAGEVQQEAELYCVTHNTAKPNDTLFVSLTDASGKSWVYRCVYGQDGTVVAIPTNDR